MDIEITLKTKLKWKGAAKYVDNGYKYSTIYVMADGGDLCLKAHKGWGTARNVFVTIHGFSSHTAVETLDLLDHYGWLTRHSRDAVLQLYKENNLDLGFYQKICKIAH